MSTFGWVTQLLYVAAAVCFVLGLRLMNSPATARRGNQVSTAGMALAIATTFALVVHAGTVTATGWIVMLAGALVGAGAGLYSARTVQMTAMPQLVSLFNAVGGGAAALVAINEYVKLAGATAGVPEATTITTILDVLIGAVTFSGSIIAAGKLQGLINAAPVTFPGSRAANITAAVVAVGGGIYMIATPSVPVMIIIILAALAFGVTMVMPIGGADMPVVGPAVTSGRWPPMTRPSSSPTRRRSSSCRGTAWPPRRPSTRWPSWPRCWKSAAPRSATPSTRSRAGCRGT